jgi:DNA polymerase III delta prime subunit
MYVNCAEGKGIKFIREELKFFAKTNIHNYGGSIVKSIVLLNADFLTIDAQSALRRCIELFSNYTRFFIVIENKSKLIKPILSRFSSMHVYRPKVKRKVTDLHTLQNIKVPRALYRKKHMAIKEIFTQCDSETLTTQDMIEQVDKIYEKGGSALDFIQYIQEHLEDSREKYDLLLYSEILKQEVRNESMLMFLLLNCYKMRNTNYLENINIL